MANKNLRFIGIILSIFVAACSENNSVQQPEAVPTETVTVIPDGNTSEIVTTRPEVLSADLNLNNVPKYQKLEMLIDLNAQFDNPYDQREIRLTVDFTAPDGSTFTVAGFWSRQWLVRFTPSQLGQWQYTIKVEDSRGESTPYIAHFDVSESDEKGWLLPGSQVNPNFSRRYLAHHSGESFYGVGHGDVFAIFSGAFDVEELFIDMAQAKENYFLWWPQFYFSLLRDNYNDYDLANAELIDEVVERTAERGYFLIFTIWDHSQLRDASHAWAGGRWWRNGFRQLVSADAFFTDQEAWAWQENWYRYVIARWGYSPAIAMWQTVSEVNGTNAFSNTNDWHEKVNHYFIDNDPYHHPTTASMAGDLTWDRGHQAMNVPQVHIYADLQPQGNVLPIHTAKVIAGYTKGMWNLTDKPNWIGEFGVINNPSVEGQDYYPELFHNAIWAALGAGSAMTPAEWNDFNTWGTMTSDMKRHMSYLSDFVELLPLAELNPEPLTIESSNDNIRGWGVAGEQGGLVWIQDYALEGKGIEQIRTNLSLRTGTSIEISGLSSGKYRIHPFNTWLGQFEPSFDVLCETTMNFSCTVLLPEFTADIAIRLERL